MEQPRTRWIGYILEVIKKGEKWRRKKLKRRDDTGGTRDDTGGTRDDTGGTRDGTGGTRDLRLSIHQPIKRQKCFLDEKELMY